MMPLSKSQKTNKTSMMGKNIGHVSTNEPTFISTMDGGWTNRMKYVISVFFMYVFYRV